MIKSGDYIYREAIPVFFLRDIILYSQVVQNGSDIFYAGGFYSLILRFFVKFLESESRALVCELLQNKPLKLRKPLEHKFRLVLAVRVVDICGHIAVILKQPFLAHQAY